MPLTGADAGMEPLGNRIVETPASPEDTEPMRNPRSGFIAYVPPGTLRTALCYPCATHEFDDAATVRALAAVGLERLQPLLDTTERWDQRLNDDEKQSLAIARVILQRPQWLVLNEALEILDPASRRRTEALFSGAPAQRPRVRSTSPARR